MLHPNGRHRARAHMTGNAITSHLKLVGNGGRRAGQIRPAQPGRGHTHPVDVDKQLGICLFDVTLPAGGMLRVGCYGRMPLQLFGPPAFGVG